jgi:hypothetical protein
MRIEEERWNEAEGAKGIRRRELGRKIYGDSDKTVFKGASGVEGE